MKPLPALLAAAAAALAVLLAIRWAAEGPPGGGALEPSGPRAPAGPPAAVERPARLPGDAAGSQPDGEERGPGAAAPLRSPAQAPPAPAGEEGGDGEQGGPLLLEVDPGSAGFSGTLTAIEWDGTVIPAASGVLELSLHCDRRIQPLSVAFAGGAFEVLLDPARGCRSLWVGEVTVEGRPALPDPPRGRTSIPRDRPLDIRVRLPRPTVLRVTEKESGRELEGVALAAAAYLPGPGFEHPGGGQGTPIAARGLASPVLLDGHLARMAEAGDFDPPRRAAGAPERRGRDRPRPALLVAAEGYAWERVELDFLRSRETRVALRPGAQLEVHVGGIDPNVGGDLRLYGADPLVPYLEESVFGDPPPGITWS